MNKFPYSEKDWVSVKVVYSSMDAELVIGILKSHGVEEAILNRPLPVDSFSTVIDGAYYAEILVSREKEALAIRVLAEKGIVPKGESISDIGLSDEQPELIHETPNFIERVSLKITEILKRPFSEWFDSFVVYGVAIVSFFVAVSFYLRTYDSAMMKITIFQIGALIFSSAWIVKGIEEGFPKPSEEQKYLLLPAICFLIWGMASFALTSYKLTSVFELSKRIQYIAIFLIVVLNFDDGKRNKTVNFILAGRRKLFFS